MKLLKWFAILLIIFSWSCKSELSDLQHETKKKDEEQNSNIDFTIELETSEGNILKPFLINNNYIHYVVSHETDLTQVKPIVMGGEILSVNNSDFFDDKRYDFSDFVYPPNIRVMVKDETLSYDIIIYDLPVLSIETPNEEPIMSENIRTEGCTVSVFLPDGIKQNIGEAGIKIRGNSTAKLPKKPYNIKFNSKKKLLNMEKSKKWVLLANAYYDRTQLHNATAFEIARFTDYDWVQSGVFVELLLNGVHNGLYYLCEKIDIQKEKINISNLNYTGKDDGSISGGYLLESDSFLTTSTHNYSFVTDFFNKAGYIWTKNGKTNCTLGWFFREPDENISDDCIDYIKNCINNMEKLLYTGDMRYKEFLDIETVINWWFVQELTLNEEASRIKNLYLYKNKSDDKLYFGPPWDFDAWTFGFTSASRRISTERFYVKNSTFYYEKLFNDPEFVKRVKEKWALYKPLWEEKIPVFIDEQYEIIHKAAERNEIIWSDWHTCNLYGEVSYKELVEEMKENYIIQLNWMNEQIEKL